MKICVLSPGVVHAVPRTVAIADQFDEVHFIDIAGKSDATTLESHNIKCYAPKLPNSVIARKQLKQLFRTIVPDIIVCHFASGDHFFDAVAYGDCPVAVIAMGQDVLYESGDSEVSHFRKLLTRMALRRTIYVSAKSNYLAKRISQFDVKAPIDVNYWGADLEHFSPGDKYGERQRLGLSEDGIYILSPRAIEPRLNIDTIIDSFKIVLESYPDAMLIIIGRADSDYLQRIKEQITRKGIWDNIALLGEVEQEKLPAYYRASDVVLSMASSEGFPNTILEVMACRIPVIIGKITQVEELLQDKKNAVVCEIAPDIIAQRMMDVLKNPANQEITEKAFQLVHANANIRKNGEIFSTQLKTSMIRHKKNSYVSILVFKCLYFMNRLSRKIFV